MLLSGSSPLIYSSERGCLILVRYVPGLHPKLQAFSLRRAAVFGLKGFTKFPSAPYLIAPRTYNVRRVLLRFARVLAVLHRLEHVCQYLSIASRP